MTLSLFNSLILFFCQKCGAWSHIKLGNGLKFWEKYVWKSSDVFCFISNRCENKWESRNASNHKRSHGVKKDLLKFERVEARNSVEWENGHRATSSNESKSKRSRLVKYFGMICKYDWVGGLVSLVIHEHRPCLFWNGNKYFLDENPSSF